MISHNIFENPTAKEKKFLKEIVEGVITSFFTDGHLTVEDLKLPKHDFFLKVKTITTNADFGFVVDHRDTILLEADNLFKRKEFDLSKIMYAMFFEHSLNSLISNFCSRKQFDPKIKNDIIRSVDLQGKLSWLLKLLDFPAFNESHRKIIKKLSEDRNSFIHYKWKVDESGKETLPNEIINEFKNIKKAVTYMKKYESKILFNNKKKVLKEKLTL